MSETLVRLGDLPRSERKRCQYDQEALSGRNLECPKCTRCYADNIAVVAAQQAPAEVL